LLKDVKAKDYNLIVFVGGSGAKVFLKDTQAHALAKEALAQKKLLGAICIAPAILAHAGLLKGKKATVWKDMSKLLKEKGAFLIQKPVAVDGNIITANGPKAAQAFGEKLAELLEQS